MADERWQEARLFPITGIGGADEQERRATSALLAVIKAVREFGRTLTARAGGPSWSSVETFIEVAFQLEGKTWRPDGVIRLSRGQRQWTALVEVKTGHTRLKADQVAAYLDVARQEEFDVVLTISPEIPTAPGVHPVQVDKRKLKRVSLQHLSWSQIHTEALIERFNRAVADEDQAWILTEFIRYLEEPKSGALDFEDMGPSWVTVRESSAQQILRPNEQNTLDVVARFDQLVAFAGMALARRVGVHVQPLLSRKELSEPAARLQDQAARLAKTGEIGGSLQVPNAVASMDINVDLRANRVDCCVTIDAPGEGRATTRVNWLLRQLRNGPPGLQLKANVARSRAVPPTFTLRQAAADPKALAGDPKADIRSFTLTMSQPAGTKRGQGRGSFVKSVVTLTDSFYSEVLQHLRPWTPSAPKVQSTAPQDNRGDQIEGSEASTSVGPTQVDPDLQTRYPNRPVTSPILSNDYERTLAP